MKHNKHKSKFVSRKLKKALKNYPCKKTRLGRYVIEVLDSYYDNGSVGIGYYDGNEIVTYDKGYDNPLGDFFHHLVYDENPLWSFDDEIADIIEKKYNSNDIEFDFDKVNDLFRFNLCG